MAGEWIKVSGSTADKPELMRMARKLGIDKDAVFGKLIRLWIWFDQNSVDGVVDGAVEQDIDEICYQSGMADALISVNWLIVDKDAERVSLPKFDRHNGETAKKRALKNERQSRWRQSCSTTTPTPASTPASTKATTREEKRREEIKTKAPGFALPPWIDPTAWQAFEEHRKKTRKPMTDRARSLIVAELEKLSPDHTQVAAILDQSIRNSWQDVFPLKEKSAKANGSAGPAWWASENGIQAKASELGIVPPKGGSWNDLKALINARLGQ